MTTRFYGQYCGLAYALELVGERWALLIVRELILGPKRFTDLRRSLPKIPTNVLSTRLKSLEQSGIIRRSVLPRPGTGVVYELTEYGSELEEVILRLGLWGAQSLGEPREEEIVTVDSLLLALRSTFRPEAARDLQARFELRLGPIVLHARVDEGTLNVGEGPLPDADVVLETDLAIRALMSGELTPEDAIQSGKLRISGKRKLVDRFVEVFHIPCTPVTLPA
jgi:DNA-binding HxlR family transcriptional regulator/putative sterol carrier protein